MTYRECFETAPMLYNACSTYQRMMDEYGFVLDPELRCSTWIYNTDYCSKISDVYRQYFAVAEKYQVPMLVYAANSGGFRELTDQNATYRGKQLIAENIAFVRDIASAFKAPIYIGLIEGCMGDQYVADAVRADEAYRWHSRHKAEWLDANPDFLYSGIMPAVEETIGMAKAFSDSGIPYNIAFIVTGDGRLLDGTTLHDAIRMVDDATANPAVQFMCNCVHPTNLLRALAHPFNRTETVRTRLLGTISNASMLKPHELECCDHIDNDSPVALVDAMLALHAAHPMRLFGGCCGTNENHMEEIVRRMQQQIENKATGV